MKVERVSIAIIVTTVLLALAMPASRMFAVAGLESLWPGGEKNVWNGKMDADIRGRISDRELLGATQETTFSTSDWRFPVRMRSATGDLMR